MHDLSCLLEQSWSGRLRLLLGLSKTDETDETAPSVASATSALTQLPLLIAAAACVVGATHWTVTALLGAQLEHWIELARTHAPNWHLRVLARSHAPSATGMALGCEHQPVVVRLCMRVEQLVGGLAGGQLAGGPARVCVQSDVDVDRSRQFRQSWPARVRVQSDVDVDRSRQFRQSWPARVRVQLDVDVEALQQHAARVRREDVKRDRAEVKLTIAMREHGASWSVTGGAFQTLQGAMQAGPAEHPCICTCTLQGAMQAGPAEHPCMHMHASRCHASWTRSCMCTCSCTCHARCGSVGSTPSPAAWP